MCLSDWLQCIDSLSILLPHLHNFAEATLADNFEQVEGFDGQRLGSRLVVDLHMEFARTSRGNIPLFGNVLLTLLENRKSRRMQK